MVEQSSSYPRVSAPLCGFKGSIYYACALLAVTAGALAFRLPGLEKRPMHVDEAVQAVKFGTLYETGVYRYDPNEFHGPTLNYATLLPAWLGAARDRTFAATSEFTYRIVPVLFGAGTVLLLFLLCDGLGWPATILAGVFTALSPALVFYNRYYIHESLLLFFTLGFIGAAWRYVQNRKLGWALLAGAFLGLMHATKETFVLSCVAMLAAVGCTFVWNRLRPSLPQRVSAAIQEDCGTVAGVGLPPLRVLLGALTAAALVSIVLFSSFFTNWAGLRDSVWTYLFWLKRAGGETLHNHPLQFYLARLLWFKEEGGPVWTEALIVLLALAGFVAALCGRGFAPRSSVVLARFLGFYTLGLTALYSLISYKTPWCMLTFLHGMILLAGLGAVAIMRSLPHWTLKALAGVLLAVGLGHLGWEAYRAS
ncbi:MAG: flippase activity-associated protein Agl23, partial [Planctomycetota bacterium]